MRVNGSFTSILLIFFTALLSLTCGYYICTFIFNQSKIIHPYLLFIAQTSVSIYEVPFDTTRAMMDLIYRGKVQKFPNIKWIVSHAGGTIPYIAYRLSTVAQENKVSSLSSGEVLAALKSLYYDVALSTSPGAFSALKELT